MSSGIFFSTKKALCKYIKMWSFGSNIEII